nr:PREDICTED: uncharacterized protein LOC109029967 isoform X1 [Bemisia tabaci]
MQFLKINIFLLVAIAATLVGAQDPKMAPQDSWDTDVGVPECNSCIKKCKMELNTGYVYCRYTYCYTECLSANSDSTKTQPNSNSATTPKTNCAEEIEPIGEPENDSDTLKVCIYVNTKQRSFKVVSHGST